MTETEIIMDIFLPPQCLTSHRQPALLIARLCAVDESGSSGRTALLPGSYDLLQCCEAAAQSVAVLMGHVGQRQQGANAASAKGMLISLKNARLHQAIPESGDCIMTVERIGSMPPMTMYQAAYRDRGEQLLMEVTLQIMSTGGNVGERSETQVRDSDEGSTA